MKTAPLPLPGLLLGDYPEQRPRDPDVATRASRRIRSALDRWSPRAGGRYLRFPERVQRLDSAPQGLPDRAQIAALCARLGRDGLSDALIAEAFVLIRRVCRHTLGLTLHPTQIVAARILLDNRLAEMATGEGKTLAAALATATAALAGIPVHVVTANEYLAARDRSELAPLYEALGLRVGCVLASMDANARRAAYDCDIAYCTAKELVFDYLRDRTLRDPGTTPLQQRAHALGGSEAPRRTVMRGLCMAVLDEADSILLDEARTPLILARAVTNADQQQYLEQALQLARGLRHGEHYTVHAALRLVELTDAGRDALDAMTRGMNANWRNRAHRDEVVGIAVAALVLYARDRHYVVRDDKVVIVDEVTGRAVPGRIWSRGLHALVELKEGLPVSGEQVTAAQITYQRFFPRYLRLCGMSGTLWEAARELTTVYGLSVKKVAPGKPCRRRILPTRLYGRREEQWRAVVARVRDVNRRGRPVLIGTDSVDDSRALSAALQAAGIAHATLNALNDAEEAEIVAHAGHTGAVTVATNMAGRGTDIRLGPGVAERGGLHIISCQQNVARRIDRQLIGRAGRQGDPGSAERLLAVDQPLLARYLPGWSMRWLRARARHVPGLVCDALLAAAQRVEEHRERVQREALRNRDFSIERDLHLGGSAE